MLVYLIFFVLLIIYTLIVVKRAKKYRYDTKQDYIYDLEKNLIQKVILKESCFELKESECETLFLKIELSFSPLSYFLKPFIEIGTTKHYFEYGAKGIRYINISNMQKGNIELKLRYLSLKNNTLYLYGYKNNINLKGETVWMIA